MNELMVFVKFIVHKANLPTDQVEICQTHYKIYFNQFDFHILKKFKRKTIF